MNLRSFADELLCLRAGESLVKVAKDPLLARFGAIGGLAGLGRHGLEHTKALATGNPYDVPVDSTTGAAVKGVAGGLTAAGILKLLGRMASKGKKG